MGILFETESLHAFWASDRTEKIVLFCMVFMLKISTISNNNHNCVLIYSTTLWCFGITESHILRILWKQSRSNNAVYPINLRMMMMLINTPIALNQRIDVIWFLNLKYDLIPFSYRLKCSFNQQNVHFLFRLFVGIVCNIS